MNIFDATVTGDQVEMYVDSGAFKARVPDAKCHILAPHLGQQIIFGIRPENIHDGAFVPPGIWASTIQAKVDVTELMGNEVFLYLECGGQEILARVDPRTSARPGLELEVALDFSKMHVFDPETGKALLA